MLWFCLGESSGARFVIEEPWPELQKKADVIVIANVASTKDLAKEDIKEIQRQESRLRVLVVLKGERVPPEIQLLHDRYKTVDEGGPPVVINGCDCLNLRVTPGEEERPAGAPRVARRLPANMPTREGQYLMFLTRQTDGRMIPVTGDCDPGNSIFALTKAESKGP